jgi:hypothetical protein
MTRISLVITFVFLSVSLSSCIKEADEVKIPTSLEDMKIVVNGFVGRNEAKVFLCQTFPFFNKNGYSFDKHYIRDAKVTISSGKDTVRLFYHKLDIGPNSYYSHDGKLPFDFIPGQKIYLNVDLPDGRHVDAVTNVPDSINIMTMRVDSMYTGKDWIYGYKYSNQSINSEYEFIFYEYMKIYEIVLDLSKDTIHNSYFISRRPTENIIFDGIYTRSSFYIKTEFESVVSIRYGNSHYITVFSFNKKLKDYYKGKSLSSKPIPNDPINSKDSTAFFEEPLFFEPVYYNNYSNINGGLGFFEAYQEKIVYVK